MSEINMDYFKELKELPWIAEGYKHIGLKEVPGSKHNLTILKWLDNLKAWWRDDETPWCGVFVGHCMQACKLDVPKFYMRAKEWANYGEKLSKPIPGCIVVFSRNGGGHVGFLLGLDKNHNPVVLGGNQGNEVNIRTLDKSRIISYNYPLRSYKILMDLKVIDSVQASQGEQ